MDDKKILEAEACGLFELIGEQVDAEEVLTAGNSFFDKSYFGTRVLVLAPHAFDEINVAGNMILTLAAAKAEVFVAYLTKETAQEAVDALKILGVPSERVIFLKRETLRRDLKRLLLDLRANIIFCVDFDSHADHRTLSIVFEEIIGKILSERNDYRPEVYKKFAYATAFNAAPDFYATNLRATKKPKLGETDTYDFDLIDRANYVWNNRVRFPVSEPCRQTLLKDNPVAEAIFAHKSKRYEWQALRILNSDEIFFERRTDSLTFAAQITATSGDASKVADFKIIDTPDVTATPAQIGNNLWQPVPTDSQRKIFFNWEEPAQVQRIVIYGSPLDEEPARISLRVDLANPQVIIDKAGISSDNVKRFDVELPSRGRPMVIDTDKLFVTRAELTVIDASKDFGLAEVEFFANVEPLHKIPPFVKLTVHDNFIYRYAVPCEVDKVSIGLYRFHVDAPVKVTATAGDDTILTEVIKDGELILNFGKATEIVLTAEVAGTDIYDRAIIQRVGDFAQIQLKVWQWLDKLRVHKIRKVDR